MKNSEQTRKEKYEKSLTPPPIRESLARIEENKLIREEISSWKKRTVIVGKDIPASGTVEDYIGYPYIVKAVEMLDAWKSRNYGNLSTYLQRCFPQIYHHENELVNVAKYLKTKFLIVLKSSKLKNVPAHYQKL